ncbi:MAG TPA: restriction endonuclease subunit S, partial [Polyangium sp.]|nr:restriction endonuclease subunit S [Polyangium sp.]
GLPGRHTRFKQTEIGEVPEPWAILRLDQLVASGPSNGRSPPSRTTPPGVRTFSIAAIRNGRVNIHDNLKYTELGIEETAKFVLESGDILIVRGNGNPDLVGKCGLVANPPADCIYPDILMRIRLREDTLSPGLFVSIWNSDLIHKQILDRAKTTNGTYKINGEDVRSIVLPVPPADEQHLLSNVLGGLADAYQVYEEKLLGLAAAKSALSSALLTGEIRVQPDEASP